MKNIFEFRDYKKFLAYAEDSRKSYERGFRARLAEALGCQGAYISRVLNGDADFSLEQAVRTATFLELKENEHRYFLSLVEFARAGTKELKEIYEKEIIKKIDENLQLKEISKRSQKLSEIDQSIYYSSWHYLAIHALTSISEFNDATSIANALKIPESFVKQVLLFLLKSNVVVEDKGKLKPGLTQVHLDRDSKIIKQHHTNLRISAIQSLMTNEKNDLHYSNISTLSKQDAELLRAEMVKLIEQFLKIVAPSKEETMYGFNLDFYNFVKK